MRAAHSWQVRKAAWGSSPVRSGWATVHPQALWPLTVSRRTKIAVIEATGGRPAMCTGWRNFSSMGVTSAFVICISQPASYNPLWKAIASGLRAVKPPIKSPIIAISHRLERSMDMAPNFRHDF
jgi:hypothetical protein